MAAVEAAEAAAATAAEATVANNKKTLPMTVGSVFVILYRLARKTNAAFSVTCFFVLTPSYLRQGSYGILFLQKYSCGTHPS